MIRVRVIAASPALRAGLISILTADPVISVRDQSAAADDKPGQDSRSEVDVVVVGSGSGSPDFVPIPIGVRPLPTLYLRNEPLDLHALEGAATPWGVLPLDTSASELQAAVRALAAGLIVAAPALVTASGDAARGDGPLTDRETEVLALLSKGLANKQIAAQLGISEHTVKFHVSSIYAKLHATNRTQAVREGLRNGWIVL